MQKPVNQGRPLIAHRHLLTRHNLVLPRLLKQILRPLFLFLLRVLRLECILGVDDALYVILTHPFLIIEPARLFALLLVLVVILKYNYLIIYFVIFFDKYLIHFLLLVLLPLVDVYQIAISVIEGLWLLYKGLIFDRLKFEEAFFVPLHDRVLMLVDTIELLLILLLLVPFIASAVEYIVIHEHIIWVEFLLVRRFLIG